MAETKVKAAEGAAKADGLAGMMEMFANTTVEQSSQGKFAASLQEIKIEEIVQNARWLQDHLHGVK